MVHRLVAGIEDAGLEVRDQLLWLYGSGVPKSRKLAGGLGSALKPAYEPIVLARRPLAGTLERNLAAFGSGVLNIDATRVGDGRYWPANVTLTHGSTCGEGRCATDCPLPLIDHVDPQKLPSRLFYCAKADCAEREAGCERLPGRVMEVLNHGGRGRRRRNIHPTVKPLALMRWIVRLVCPAGGVVLDPFAGSGSTGVAVNLEGRQFVGIEREPGYVAIGRARLSHWAKTAEARASRRELKAPRLG